MTQITRVQDKPRMSKIVTHGDTIYLSGQVGNPGDTVAEQTQTTLDRIDALLAEAGSDKSKILQAIIWLDDMRAFDEMNAVWDAWVAKDNGPARACGSAHLATKEHLVEITVIAAK